MLGWGGGGLGVMGLPSQVSYVEMVHPSDFRTVELTWRDGQAAVRTPLFADRLEKGVIRRGRVRGWLVSSPGDLAAAERLFREFAESEPPLTT